LTKDFFRAASYASGMLNNDLTDSLAFSLLGPIRAWRGGTELDLGSPQQRTTLAMLLLREGAVATLDELIDGMWGDEPPRSAETTIRTYVSRLRTVLDAARAAARLDSVSGGYTLQVADDALDVARFRRHTTRAAEAARRGDWRTVVAEQTAALRLWRGQPLAGSLGPYADGQRTRLQQLGTAARIELLTAQVQLGVYAEILPELTAMAAAHPLWEDVQALHMTALYGSGRAAEALQQYQRARRVLVDELGIEPGVRLRTVHQRILASDPSLATVSTPVNKNSARPAAVLRGRYHARMSRRRGVA
jgi:DNA-binding SARP family transcriptional activator